MCRKVGTGKQGGWKGRWEESLFCPKGKLSESLKQGSTKIRFAGSRCRHRGPGAPAGGASDVSFRLGGTVVDSVSDPFHLSAALIFKIGYRHVCFLHFYVSLLTSVFVRLIPTGYKLWAEFFYWASVIF